MTDDETNTERWQAVDRYIADTLIGRDAALDAAVAASDAAGLPQIAVAPNQGKLLHLLALVRGAKRILEIGTLGGYSTIWLARALPAGGRLITLEAEETHARVARSNIERAGLGVDVEVRLGPALETLPRLAAEGAGPFDLTFIDADKPNIPAYFEWSLKLAAPGGLIVVDNVIRDGAVADASSTDPSVLGVRRLNEMLRDEPRVTATTIQMVGSKGYDGMTVVLVRGDSSRRGGTR